jgi:hypothetical protein
MVRTYLLSGGIALAVYYRGLDFNDVVAHQYYLGRAYVVTMDPPPESLVQMSFDGVELALAGRWLKGEDIDST